MARKQIELINNEFYHLVIRGVGDSLIFKNIDDYYRGIFSLYEFNNAKSVSIKDRRKARANLKKKSRGSTSGKLPQEVDKREKFVQILSFCLMPNHIHLLVKQIKDGGITEFMRKVGTGYAVYFNKKYNRKGHLFQGFRTVHIKDNNQLKNVSVYIHTNPISLIEPKWKEKGIKNPKKTMKFLETYRWSSYLDYIGKKNFPSVSERDFLIKSIGGIKLFKKSIENWIKYKAEFINNSFYLELE
ncbi:MAG: transposase [Minisyncoccales bacterium]